MLMARLPLARVPERLALYEAGLAESGLDGAAQRRLREQAALWRFVHVADSQARAEDELAAALRGTRHHMVHARAAHNPPGFAVDVSRINPWNDPRVRDEDGMRHALAEMALYGTERRVAEQMAELRDAGVHHVLCQLSTGYLSHARVMESMRRFGAGVIPRFRRLITASTAAARGASSPARTRRQLDQPRLAAGRAGEADAERRRPASKPSGNGGVGAFGTSPERHDAPSDSRAWRRCRRRCRRETAARRACAAFITSSMPCVPPSEMSLARSAS